MNGDEKMFKPKYSMMHTEGCSACNTCGTCALCLIAGEAIDLMGVGALLSTFGNV